METNATELPTGNASGYGPTSVPDLVGTEVYLAISEGVMGVVLCLTGWVIISLLVYGKKVGNWKNTRSGRMYIICFLSAAMNLPGIVLQIMLLCEAGVCPSVTSGHCELRADFSNVTRGLALYFTYLFLWLRQRAIYGNPTLKKMYGKCVNVLSWITFTIVTVGFTLLLLGTTIPSDYSSTKTGCQVKSTEQRTFINIFVIGSVIFGQGSLLSLFVYPLIQNRLERKKINASPHSSKDKIMTAIRRSATCAVVAAVTDVVVFVGGDMFAKTGYPVAIGECFMEIDVLINSLTIVASYKSGKSILTVLCCGNRVDKPKALKQHQLKNAEKV